MKSSRKSIRFDLIKLAGLNSSEQLLQPNDIFNLSSNEIFNKTIDEILLKKISGLFNGSKESFSAELTKLSVVLFLSSNQEYYDKYQSKEEKFHPNDELNAATTLAVVEVAKYMRASAANALCDIVDESVRLQGDYKLKNLQGDDQDNIKRTIDFWNDIAKEANQKGDFVTAEAIVSGIKKANDVLKEKEQFKPLHAHKKQQKNKKQQEMQVKRQQTLEKLKKRLTLNLGASNAIVSNEIDRTNVSEVHDASTRDIESRDKTSSPDTPRHTSTIAPKSQMFKLSNILNLGKAPHVRSASLAVVKNVDLKSDDVANSDKTSSPDTPRHTSPTTPRSQMFKLRNILKLGKGSNGRSDSLAEVNSLDLTTQSDVSTSSTSYETAMDRIDLLTSSEVAVVISPSLHDISDQSEHIKAAYDSMQKEKIEGYMLGDKYIFGKIQSIIGDYPHILTIAQRQIEADRLVEKADQLVEETKREEEANRLVEEADRLVEEANREEKSKRLEEAFGPIKDAINEHIDAVLKEEEAKEAQRLEEEAFGPIKDAINEHIDAVLKEEEAKEAQRLEEEAKRLMEAERGAEDENVIKKEPTIVEIYLNSLNDKAQAEKQAKKRLSKCHSELSTLVSVRNRAQMFQGTGDNIQTQDKISRGARAKLTALQTENMFIQNISRSRSNSSYSPEKLSPKKEYQQEEKLSPELSPKQRQQ